MINFVKSFVRKIIRSGGYELVSHANDSALPIWVGEDKFEAAFQDISALTLVPMERCFGLWQLAHQAALQPGAFAEFGVYRGGTARMLARAFPDRTIHLFDTFAGMPQTDPRHDGHAAGDFADTSLDAVSASLGDCPNVRFHPGFFPDSTADVAADERFAFVHVDVDIYRSTLDALTFFYPRLMPGGIMVFDDWRRHNTQGVEAALTAFLADKPERIYVSARHQAAIIHAGSYVPSQIEASAR